MEARISSLRPRLSSADPCAGRDPGTEWTAGLQEMKVHGPLLSQASAGTEGLFLKAQQTLNNARCVSVNRVQKIEQHYHAKSRVFARV